MHAMIYCFALVLMMNACTSTETESNRTDQLSPQIAENPTTAKRYRGTFSNGMKGDSIFFNVSADGKTLSELTFKGYWRCSGKLEQTTVGPDGVFTLNDGKVNDHITEPPGGGSTAWRFDLDATINGDAASGTFRMNINNLGCDTYKLNWEAKAY